MSGDIAAYRTLGLEPGADQAAIDSAYRQLIKRYHPDREGGDAARAAELNEAYFQLRRAPPQQRERDPPRDLAEALYAERLARRRYVAPKRRRPRIWPLLLLALAITLYLKREPLLAQAEALRLTVADSISPTQSQDHQSIVSAGDTRFDGPLDRQIIASAVDRASQLTSRNQDDALIEESRACYRSLQADPSLGSLDRCAAFDDAVIEIENRGTVREGGPFGASAVTARQMAGAKLLSGNYEAIEERLDRVRSQVQLALTPPELPIAASSNLAEPASGTAGGLPPLVSGSDGAAPH